MDVLGPIIAGARGCEQMERCAVVESSRGLLESVWSETASQLSRLVLAMGLRADRVDDVLQDVYLIALRKHPPELGRDDLRLWLYRVAVNRCNLDHRRGRRWQAVWQKLVIFCPRSVESGAEDATRHDEQQQLVADALKTLDPELRTVLVLRYFENLNSKEIGRILELSDSTVRSHLRKARCRLAKALKGVGYDDEIEL